MHEIEETGGARIGMANASWPFAKLKVTREKLELNASIMGNLYFRPADVISIEPYGILLKNGIKINHRVKTYSSKVVFTTSNYIRIIWEIEESGFLSNTDPLPMALDTEITTAQLQGGFPIKRNVAIAIAVIWSLLIFSDSFGFFKGTHKASPLGTGTQLALGFMLLTGVLTLTVEPVRELILKEGRTLKDIRIFLLFLMLICVFMLVATSLIPQS